MFRLIRISGGGPAGAALPALDCVRFKIKTAKALGTTVPLTLLARADEVIE
jgi:hypothetical protein